MNTTNTTPMCLHCGRPIRGDARTYAANGGYFHWECTEPAPALRVAALKLDPGDSVAVLLDGIVSADTRRHIEEYVSERLGTASVLVVDGGAGLSVLAQTKTPNVGINRRPCGANKRGPVAASG